MANGLFINTFVPEGPLGPAALTYRLGPNCSFGVSLAGLGFNETTAILHRTSRAAELKTWRKHPSGSLFNMAVSPQCVFHLPWVERDCIMVRSKSSFLVDGFQVGIMYGSQCGSVGQRSIAIPERTSHGDQPHPSWPSRQWSGGPPYAVGSIPPTVVSQHICRTVRTLSVRAVCRTSSSARLVKDLAVQQQKGVSLTGNVRVIIVSGDMTSR